MTCSRIVLAAACLAAALVGCGAGGTVVFSLGGPSGTLGWDEPVEKGKKSPFDSGMIDYAGTTFAVWCDWMGGSGLGTSGSGGGTTIDGHLRFPDGKTVAVSCRTTDGRTGPVTIGEHTFDLAAGNLFLVSGPSDQPRVKQLKRHLSRIDFTKRRSVQAYGQADQEITAFFTRDGKPN